MEEEFWLNQEPWPKGGEEDETDELKERSSSEKLSPSNWGMSQTACINSRGGDDNTEEHVKEPRDEDLYSTSWSLDGDADLGVEQDNRWSIEEDLACSLEQ